MNTEEVFATIKAALPGATIVEVLDNKDPYLLVPARHLVDICKFLRDDPRLKCDFLQCLSAVDYLDRIAVVYHIESIFHEHRVILKVELPREDSRVASVTGIWKAADWHEREAFDLVGVRFEGHPELKRILCAEDWEGHPLRKDYAFPVDYHGVACNFSKARLEWAERGGKKSAS